MIVDLPMPGAPPISTSEPGHQAASEHAVELADAGAAAARPSAPRRRRAGPGVSARPPERAGAAAARAGARGALLLGHRVPLAAAGATPVPLGALVAARGAGEDGGGTRHPARLSARVDGFAPPPRGSRRDRAGARGVSMICCWPSPVAAAISWTVTSWSSTLICARCDVGEPGVAEVLEQLRGRPGCSRAVAGIAVPGSSRFDEDRRGAPPARRRPSQFRLERRSRCRSASVTLSGATPTACGRVDLAVRRARLA